MGDLTDWGRWRGGWRRAPGVGRALLVRRGRGARDGSVRSVGESESEAGRWGVGAGGGKGRANRYAMGSLVAVFWEARGGVRRLVYAKGSSVGGVRLCVHGRWSGSRMHRRWAERRVRPSVCISWVSVYMRALRGMEASQAQVRCALVYTPRSRHARQHRDGPACPRRKLGVRTRQISSLRVNFEGCGRFRANSI